MQSLPPGEYRVGAVLKGRPNLFLQDISLQSGQNKLDLRMTKGAVIQGRVIDVSTGRPIAMAKQEMSISTHDRHGVAYAGMNYAEVQPDGTFKLLVPAGLAYLGMYVGPKWQKFRIDETPRAAFSDKGIEITEGQTVDVEIRFSPPDEN